MPPRTNPMDLLLMVVLTALNLSQITFEWCLKEMRKHLGWYIKNLKDASKIREKVNTLKTRQEVIDCLEEYFSVI